VIPHRAVVGHVYRLPPAHREKRQETEARHTFHIAFGVAAGVVGEERINRGGHWRTVAAVAASVNLEYRARETTLRMVQRAGMKPENACG
jgi:hypothetical protein